ncbi:hypothetical protein GGS21DRAFT_101099 [Xylaria nigripes]|nr:hypothetical protein GGS21DRAFT_101099 [Xylaria nigripes]
MLPVIRTCTKPELWFTEVKAGARCRKLRAPNRLHQDEHILEQCGKPSRYWREVLKMTPPREWMDTAKIFAYLAQARPRDKPSNYKYWKSSKDWLDEAIRQGDAFSWRDDARISPPRTDPENWEALRIIGDTQTGYGTFPSTLAEGIQRAGFAWILVHPTHRVVPKCWEHWARHYDIPFASIATTTHDQTYVSTNPDATKTLQSLNAAVAPKPPPYEMFSLPNQLTCPETDKLYQALQRHQQYFRNHIVQETQHFITRLLQDAIKDGPFEAHTRDILARAMTTFEINFIDKLTTATAQNNAELRQLCETTTKQISDHLQARMDREYSRIHDMAHQASEDAKDMQDQFEALRRRVATMETTIPDLQLQIHTTMEHQNDNLARTEAKLTSLQKSIEETAHSIQTIHTKLDATVTADDDEGDSTGEPAELVEELMDDELALTTPW